jgi:hypothetical protein
MNLVSELAEHWLGLCPKSPMMRTTATVLMSQSDVVQVPAPEGSAPIGRPGRVRDGISIAVASLKAQIRDRQLLGFTFLAGLLMLFLVFAEAWNNTNVDPAPSFPGIVRIGDMPIYVNLQDLWVDIPLGNSSFFFDIGLFLIEMVCLSGFILVLTGLTLYRNGNHGRTPVTVRAWLSVVRSSLGSLAALSLGMALLAILAYDFISHSQFFGGIIHAITMALFWLPYSYYQPQGTFALLYASAYFFALEIMLINLLLFLAILYLVPVIVLEKKGLTPAFAGSLKLLKRTWRELAGCLIVFGSIALAVFAVGLLIGQSPVLINNDFDFFISRSRGYLPMMVVCYGFIVALWVIMAAGFTTAGVALSDLYAAGTTGRVTEPVRVP